MIGFQQKNSTYSMLGFDALSSLLARVALTDGHFQIHLRWSQSRFTADLFIAGQSKLPLPTDRVQEWAPTVAIGVSVGE